jgi:AP-3 complex subunit beta
LDINVFHYKYQNVGFFSDREQFQLGTLSHILNTRATGYQELPDWPEVAPDSSVRNIELPNLFDEPTKPKTREKKKVAKKETSFYSDESSSVGM